MNIIFDFSIEGFSNFSNENKIPLLFKDATNYNDPYPYPSFILCCFEKDKQIVDDFIFYTKPVYIDSEVFSVSNEAEYTQQKLLEVFNEKY